MRTPTKNYFFELFIMIFQNCILYSYIHLYLNISMNIWLDGQADGWTYSVLNNVEIIYMIMIEEHAKGPLNC